MTPDQTLPSVDRKVQEGAMAARWMFSLAIRKQNAHLEQRAVWVQVALRAGGNPVPGGFWALTRQNPHWPAPALIIVWAWRGMDDPQGPPRQHYKTKNMYLFPQNTYSSSGCPWFSQSLLNGKRKNIFFSFFLSEGSYKPTRTVKLLNK